MKHNISKYDYYADLPDGYEKFIPIGNGRIGASVWTSNDNTSDIHLLLSATNSFSELGRLLKIGKACISISPCVFNEHTKVRLDLNKAELCIVSDEAEVTIYIDALNDVLCFTVKSNIPITVTYSLDNYRNRALTAMELDGNESNYAMAGTARFHNMGESADIVKITKDKKAIIQYHRNDYSCFNYALFAQGLSDRNNKQSFNDPYLHLTFGTYAKSDQMLTSMQENQPMLTSIGALKELKMQIWSLSKATESVEQWEEGIALLGKNYDIQESFVKHLVEWETYWNRYYIYAYGTKEAETLTKAWIYQKYFNRCAGRGPIPIKFNGSIFVTYPSPISEDIISWDYRRWGAAFWIQNTRHVYWNMMLSGDFEGMAPLYETLEGLIPICQHRCRTYFGHNGMLLPETFTIGGLYCMSNYGLPKADEQDPMKRYERGTWLHRPDQVANHYIRWHYNGMLELSYLMLLGAKFSDNKEYLEVAYKFSYETLTFFYEHFDVLYGKLLMKPISALETYQDCVNDLPDIAGLDALTQELLGDTTTPLELKELSQTLRDSLVEYPKDDEKLLPCETLIDKRRGNIENPELYSIFPFYRHTLLNKSDPLFQYAVNAFNERVYKAGFGWSQDCIQAALLGLKDQAEDILIKQAENTDKRYSFWGIYGPNYDDTPDQDHANGLSIGFMHSLIQSSAQGNMLFLAWPKGWNVSFKLPLHSSKSVTVEYLDNIVTKLEFESEADRAKTIINAECIDD